MATPTASGLRSAAVAPGPGTPPVVAVSRATGRPGTGRSSVDGGRRAASRWWRRAAVIAARAGLWGVRSRPMAVPAPFWPGGLVTSADLDVAALAGLVAAGTAYAVGVRRLARAWPIGRSAAFALGLLAVAVATQSGLADASDTWYSAHVVEHLLVGMVGPVLLALGAPVTLAVQAGSRRTQRAVIELLDLPVVRLGRRPLVVLVVFLATLVALNLPVVVEAGRAQGWLHALLHVHALVVGLAFASLVTGADPAAWRVSPPVRLGVALLTIPAHAFVAMAVLGAGTGLADPAVLGAERALADQRLGAALLWVGGDLVGLAVTFVAATAWARAERREGARSDRRASPSAVAPRVASPPSNSTRSDVGRRKTSSGSLSSSPHRRRVDSTSIRRVPRGEAWRTRMVRRRARGVGAEGRGRAGRLAAALGTAVLLAGCSQRYGVPESAAEQGDAFLDLWRVFTPIAIVVVLFIWALVLYVVVRSRRWRRAAGEPSQHQYDGPIELAGLVIPLVLVAVLFALTVVRTDEITAVVDDPDRRVEVLGFQWSWRFTYLEEGVAVTGLPGEVPVLRLPLGETVRFDLVSEDVIHSFWVPEFLTKRDLVPGIDNEIDITPTRAGRWTSRCAEYCGLNHTDMRFVVEVMGPAAFDAWAATAAEGGGDDPTVSTVAAGDTTASTQEETG
ncbi:MAG: cytochrome c oxidase subunit II [Acidimicrobiia bacterium]|nr:cytochrome c oxidase subunit II [Acidimicrobiia bacterium]